jgi:hypothetical protein
MHTSTRLHLGIRGLLALLLTLALLPLLAPAPARAAGFTVTTLADSGDGSLRQVILDANGIVGADTITFTVSGTIRLASTLPAINDELTIDGTGQSITISGENTVRVIAVNRGKTLNLNALTVMNGFACAGAGIYNRAGTVNITNSTFAGNVSSGCAGGGALNENGIMNVTNSTFSGNSGSIGGAISHNGLTLNVTNSTFSNNSGREGINANAGTATLRNTLVVNSVGRNCAGTITDGGSNLQFGGSTANSCGATIPTPAADPLGGNTLADNGGPTPTIALLVGSAAIDAIPSANCAVATDQRGIARPQGSACDIGAFELQPQASDATAPTTTISSPADGAVYLLGQSVTASYACQDENGGSGLAECIGTVASGASIDTASVGSHTFTVNAADTAGNTASKSVTYQVVYNWSGFFQPIDNLPTVNSAKAGSAIPVTFSLGGNYGLNIFASGYPRAQAIPCDGGAPTDDIETVSAGASGLSYDAATGQYTYTWKTDKKWAGTCRQLVLKLVDGTEHIASFTFR